MALTIVKSSTSSMSSLSQSRAMTAARSNPIPDDWVTDLFAPGAPIQPQAQRQSSVPREIDYPIAANITWTPRTVYGLSPFSLLKSAYDAITEVSLPVLTIVRELLGFNAHLINADGDELNDHPLQWILEAPDGETPFDVWMTRFLKNALIYDAGAFRIQQSHGELQSLDYIDGSTLTLIINERGRLPKPDEISQDTATQSRYIEKAQKWLAKGNSLPQTTPAFVQVIHGIPFSWWDQDQVWYKPRSRTIDTPYGETFIERSFAWVHICANVAGFELAHYRTGNMPEGWSETPEGWDENRTVLWEETFNARMSSGPAERQRVRFLPHGFIYHETKKPNFPVQLYEQARDNISLSLGLPVSELGKVPGQGLGGKGFGEAMESSLFRNALMPVKSYFEGAINSVFRRMGVDDAFLELQLPILDTDPEKQKEAIKGLFASGLYSINDALGELGKDPIEGGDIHIVVQGGQIIVLEDFFKHPDAPTQTNGVAQTEPAPQSQRDIDAAGQLLTNAANTGKMSTKTISIPASVGTATKASKSAAQYTDVASNPVECCQLCKHYNGQGGCDVVDGAIAPQGWCKYFEAGVEKAIKPLLHPHDHNHHFAPKGVVDMAGIKRVGKELGVNFDAHQMGALRSVIEGLIAEIEGKQQLELGKVDTAVLEKHCGVCEEDDEYFGADISREAPVNFPATRHANGVEIVAATPAGLEPKPFLWKPEGEENSSLQDYIGGPQYVREEAAYLIDRSLGFYLVPVAFVAEADEERGAAVYYTHGMGPAYTLVDDYAPDWCEKAGVLDFVIGQMDRGMKHNFSTHPDDPTRPIFYDNGLCLPDSDMWPQSPFCDLMEGKPLSQDTLNALLICRGDAACWADVSALVGSTATTYAKQRLQRLIEAHCVPFYAAVTAGSATS